jgi:hypothetical protein
VGVRGRLGLLPDDERDAEISYNFTCGSRGTPAQGRRQPEEARVSFDEAATAFDDELGAYYPDALHPERFILIGQSYRRRLL